MTTTDPDDDLRAALRDAHAGDAPPRYTTTLARPARRPARAVWALPAVAAVCAGLIALLLVTPPLVTPLTDGAPGGIDDYRVSVHAPLDFLLDTPGNTFLATTPTFDTKGLMP